MPIFKHIVSASFSILLATFCTLGSAQRELGQWVGDSYLVKLWLGTLKDSTVYAFIDEEGRIQKTIPNVSKAVDFPAPLRYRNEYFYSCHLGDSFYTIAAGMRNSREDGSLFRRWIFAKYQEDEWHYLGQYKGSDTLLHFIPCENGRFILISLDEDLTGAVGPRRTPFFRASFPPSGGELQIDAPIDHAQDGLHKYMGDRDYFSIAWLSKVIMTEKHAVVLSQGTGMYWVFSLEKATLVKAGNIFGKVTPERIGKGFYFWPILCANPEKDGTVLISARDEDHFMKQEGDFTTDFNKHMVSAQISAGGLMSSDDLQKAANTFTTTNTHGSFVVWHRIHPESGKSEKLSDAPEGGTLLLVMKRGSENWRPMPDGSVKMGWDEDAIRQQAKDLLEEEEPKKEESSADAQKEPAQASDPPPKTDPPKITDDTKKNDQVAK
jgi:hypothetical protein